MLKTITLALLAVLLCSSIGNAQTVSRSLAWSHLNDTQATVTSYTFSEKIDAAPAVAVTPTCAQSGANVTCSTPITLTSGNHTIVVTATNAGGSASGTLNYVPPTAPTTPSTVSITITINVP